MCIIKLYNLTLIPEITKNKNVEMRKILSEESTLNNKLWYEIINKLSVYNDDDLKNLFFKISGTLKTDSNNRIFWKLFPHGAYAHDYLKSINNDLIIILLDDYDNKYQIVISRLLYSISINYEDLLIYIIKNLVLSYEDEKRKSDLNNAISNLIGSDNKIYNDLTKINIFVKYIAGQHIKEKHLSESIINNLKNL